MHESNKENSFKKGQSIFLVSKEYELKKINLMVHQILL